MHQIRLLTGYWPLVTGNFKMRKFKIGECVTARLPDSKSIGTVKANVSVRGTIIALSPDRRFAKLLLNDNTELLIETRFFEVTRHQ